MITYIIRRLLLLPVVLLGVTLLIFTMIQFLSPMERLVTYINSPEALRHMDLDALIAKYHLDDPAPLMYWRWLKNLFTGNLGWSESSNMTVVEAIKARFPATLELTLFSFIPVVLGGIWLGTKSAVNHNNPVDHGTRVFAIVGYALPSFVFGLLVLMIFYGVLKWLPPGRLSLDIEQIVMSDSFNRYTGMNTIDAILNWRWDVFLDAIRHLIAPTITLSYLWWAFILRITRSSMLDVMNQDYVRTARAKGLAENVVIKKHARRNALIPVTTVAGMMVMGLLGGVMITETVFDYKGLGLLTASAAQQIDVPMVIGVAMFYAALLVIINLVVDLLYAIIDPRVRLE